MVLTRFVHGLASFVPGTLVDWAADEQAFRWVLRHKAALLHQGAQVNHRPETKSGQSRRGSEEAQPANRRRRRVDCRSGVFRADEESASARLSARFSDA
jgi:hypothetical protein